MVTIPTASVLSDDEKATINRLAGQIRANAPKLRVWDRYYDAEQRLKHIGLAIPAEARIFETIINIPRMAVNEPVLRQRLKAFYRAGDSTKIDATLQASWESNNLPSESSVCHTETRIFGRSFVAVGKHPDEGELPLITVESPLEIGCEVDRLRRRMSNALRLYRDPVDKVTRGTLYAPNETVYLVRGQHGWQVDDTDGFGRDQHNLGAVPMVMFLNARRAGRFEGRSEMADVVTKTDAIARMITNTLIGGETHALPARWVAGATTEDFVDEDGNPMPVWESYFTAIRAIKDANAKFGEWTAGDLKNLTDAVDKLLTWCSVELGLPTRYVGQSEVNPAAEGAIRADESRLIVRTKDKNRHDGDSWAWVMGLEERIRTGEWGERNSIRALWHDPGTGTLAEAADAATKLTSIGALSTEGVWDMLEWDEPRKQLERERLDAQADSAMARAAADPLILAANNLAAASGNPSPSGS